VMDMATATEEEVSYHRKMQAEGMTRHLTSEHHPNLVAEVHKLRGVLERMSLQLYSEFVTLTHVVRRAMEHGMLYYCQRLPGELARFRWVIDAKSNLNITPHEDWWRVCVKPMLQSRSLRDPLIKLKGGGSPRERAPISQPVRSSLLWRELCAGDEAPAGRAQGHFAGEPIHYIGNANAIVLNGRH